MSLVDVVENADADVVEAEILLDVADDVGQHLLGIFTRNRGLRNIVEEGQLARTPLLFGEEAGIFHRDGNLPRRGLHHFQIALFEDILAFRVHRRHHSGRPASQQDGRAAKTLGGPRRHKGDAQPLPRFFQIGADQQRLAAANDVLGQAIGQFARALGQNLALLHFQFEADLVAFLKRDVEVAGVEDLAQFLLDGAQNLVLVQPRADGLSDLGEQRELFGAALRIVHDHVVFQGQADLQRQPDQQPQVR